MNRSFIRNILLYSLLFVFLCLVFLLYKSGLSGAFMLDDWSTLPTLFTTIETCGLECGVFSGSTGPTGRPVSLLSFAFQANFWPNPYYFKLVNVLIHIVNTLLVFFVFKIFLQTLNKHKYPFCIALTASLLWASWPLQVSSVLYVVQRMVLLSSFFVLIGLLVYLIMRPRLNNIWKLKFGKWIWLILALGFTGIAAIFSKESGILLIVYIFIFEIILFTNDSNTDVCEKWFKKLCLYLPLLCLLSYLVYKAIFQSDYLYLTREFDLHERLLTQCRVLMDYLGSLFLPKPSQLGLYNDAYSISTSLFSPISTFLSLLGICLLIFFAFKFRKKYALFSIAIFWFLGGHILESTVLPLELYFEHRNYLPIMMLSLALIVLIYKLISEASSTFVKFSFIACAFCYFISIGLILKTQVDLWGNPIEYSAVQASEHPRSIRARSLLVDVYNRTGQVDKAYEYVAVMKKDFPSVSGVILSDIEFACYDSKYKLENLDTIKPKLEQAKFGFGGIVTIANAAREILNNECKGVPPDYLLDVIKIFKDHPLYIKKKHLMENYEVSLLTKLGRYKEAIKLYSSMALLPEQWPRYISLLASQGRLLEAKRVSDLALTKLKWKIQYEIYYKDVLRLREIIQLDMTNRKK